MASIVGRISVTNRKLLTGYFPDPTMIKTSPLPSCSEGPMETKFSLTMIEE